MREGSEMGSMVLAADPKGVSRILREHKAKKGAGGNSLGNNSLVG